MSVHKRIGQLDSIQREGENSDHHVVLLHGFGADAGDLAPLADLLDPEHLWNFTFPEAPLEVPIGPGFVGRGWFPISLRDLEVGVDFTQIRPPGLNDSAKMVSELIFHLNPKKLVLGGFSQGAMVATDVALHQPNDINGLILYSGVLLDEKGWSKLATDFKGKPFLQSHGVNDSVLPIRGAERLFQMLKGAGAEGSFLSFSGGHEIPMPVLKKTSEFLRQI